ncbi:dihydrofolate reductase family protein [bacterium]|nr:dihydrofolate reductase family protein [bacterium]
MNEIKASVFIATSLDGFIARKDGSLDWLDKMNATVTPGEDCGYMKFIESVDVLVMGRNSYEKVLSFGIDWPYTIPVVVLSRQNLEIPEELMGKVTHQNLAPVELCDFLKSEGYKSIYVDGGNTISRFLKAGLISEMIITQVPVVLGEGIPLFDGLESDLELKLLSSQSFDFGFVQNRFEVV